MAGRRIGRMLAAIACAALTLSCGASGAERYSFPWVVFADSLTTAAQREDPRLLPWPTITQERGVVFNALGGPGAAMGAIGAIHYNAPDITNDASRVCGYLTYCAGAIIQAGVNDYILNVPWAEQERVLTSLLDWAAAMNKKIIMLDLVYYGGGEDDAARVNEAGLSFAALRENRRRLCEARAPVCVFFARPSELSVFDARYFQSDRLHLMPDGWRAYATWVENGAAQAGLF